MAANIELDEAEWKSNHENEKTTQLRKSFPLLRPVAQILLLWTSTVSFTVHSSAAKQLLSKKTYIFIQSRTTSLPARYERKSVIRFFSQHVDIVNRQNDCNCCWYNITDPKVISILNDRGVFKLFSSTNPHAPRQFSNRYRSFNTPIIENCVKEPCERMALVWVSHKYRDAFASFTGDASRSVTLSVIQRFRGQTQMEPIFWAKHNTLSSAQAADCKRWYIIEFSKSNRKPGAWKRTGPIVRSSV